MDARTLCPFQPGRDLRREAGVPGGLGQASPANPVSGFGEDQTSMRAALTLGSRGSVRRQSQDGEWVDATRCRHVSAAQEALRSDAEHVI